MKEFERKFIEEHRHDRLGAVATRLQFENERVRVWEMALAPGEASDLHHHDRDYLVVLLEGDRVAAIPGPGTGGAYLEAEVVPGHVAYVPKGETEWAVNIGNKPFREIVIELKA